MNGRVPELLRNPPISVIVVGWVRMNAGPTNWELRTDIPPDPDTLNCVVGVAAPKASSIETVGVPKMRSALSPRPRLEVSFGPAASLHAPATRVARPKITNGLIVPPQCGLPHANASRVVRFSRSTLETPRAEPLLSVARRSWNPAWRLNDGVAGESKDPWLCASGFRRVCPCRWGVAIGIEIARRQAGVK